jgi:hypothetical protein
MNFIILHSFASGRWPVGVKTNYKLRVEFTLEQAMKAQRGSSDIPLLLL